VGRGRHFTLDLADDALRIPEPTVKEQVLLRFG
jgi:hypothetical protein